jgi:hypothetical protein
MYGVCDDCERLGQFADWQDLADRDSIGSFIQRESGCSAPAPPPCLAACSAKTQAAACAGTDCKSSCKTAMEAAQCSWVSQASATKTCPAGCQTKIDAMYVACSGCGDWDATTHLDMAWNVVPLAASIRNISGCTESQAKPKAKTCPAGCQTKIDAMYGACAGCGDFADAGRQAQLKATFRSMSGCAPGGSPSIGNSGGGNSGTPSPVLSPPPLPPIVFAEITLDINVETIAAGTPQRAIFETNFKRDLSLKLGGIDTARIIIVEVKAASAMVAFEILPDPSSNIVCVCSLDALLKEQMADHCDSCMRRISSTVIENAFKEPGVSIAGATTTTAVYVYNIGAAAPVADDSVLDDSSNILLLVVIISSAAVFVVLVAVAALVVLRRRRTTSAKDTTFDKLSNVDDNEPAVKDSSLPVDDSVEVP